MNERRTQMLAAGLDAFDRRVENRRRWRRAGAGLVLTALVVAALAGVLGGPPGVVPAPAPGSGLQARRPLPAYLEIIRDDASLSSELALADACERVGREGDRVFLVECAAAPTPPGSPWGR